MAEQPPRSSVRRYEPPPGPEALGDILGKLFVARGWGRRQGRLQLESAWVEAVGPVFAGHTRLGALRRGVLEVIVDSGVLLQELAHYHKRRLLTALRQRLVDTPLTDLRFRAGVLD
jgi:predicted nucleic acid-binding Zn ribbon protein